MKIDQMSQLNNNISQEQLNVLINASESDVDEYLRIQKFFNGLKLKIDVSKEMQTKFMENLYKLSTNQYIHTVNEIMDSLSEYTVEEDYRVLYTIAERIANDIDKGIIYTNKFIDNIIRSSIVEENSVLELFDIYNEAKKDENLKDKIFELISNDEFITNRPENINAFVKKLKYIFALENKNTNRPTFKYTDILFQIITSNDLLWSRTAEEHLNLINFFIYSFNEETSYKMLELFTGLAIAHNRTYDEQLYILDLYNNLVLHNENTSSLYARLFTDKALYMDFPFDLQIYLIEIFDKITEPAFFEELETIINLDEDDIVVSIKEIIKKYTDYALTVKQIINTSSNGEQAVNLITSEARDENIEEINSETKLVLVPHHDISGSVNNLLQSISK